jgi:RNA polymerase sigma-70 factor (ECF subfamily)
MSTAREGNKTTTRLRYETELTGLYEEYYARIARYAHVHIGDRSDAEDLAGEVFLKALKSLDSYHATGVPMQAWLFKIAHNLVVDYLRKKTKVKSMSADINMELLQAGDDDPVGQAETTMQMERVTAAMQGLTAEQRQVVGLRFLGELSSKEVAQVMNKGDGAVREMQRAAIEKLRTVLVGETWSGGKGKNGSRF